MDTSVHGVGALEQLHHLLPHAVSANIKCSYPLSLRPQDSLQPRGLPIQVALRT